MMIEFDVELPGGPVLHAYDTGGDGFPVLWHHGTPNVGAPPAPLFADAERFGLRWLSYDRFGYGGSSASPGRDVASAAACSAAVADAAGVGRFAVVGHSGGGPHALACGALSPERVVAVVSVSGLAPYGAEGLDWFAGMAESGAASLRAAAAGRAAKVAFEASAGEQDPGFTSADWAALAGEWAWFESVVGPALGASGAVDDELAYVAEWGFDPADVVTPVLLVHGGRDRVVPVGHARWLARRCAGAELWVAEEEGHLSVLAGAASWVEWVRARWDEGVGR
ncbi:pimeloyl-ACP methyl ester carboxylesterase [Saccharothrix longispora]|uniref:Pimeloyl-ACP methyl ester carboxylesterase n=2 Tax=Saccharothrix longispora TaxID=33920 RepID=A0ABU1PTZ4_9PSEU|nr:pimeloyl-ACP methyl ester carboxylesterase [Saccharothrix longispora]